MKTNLTLTIETELFGKAKNFAQDQNTCLTDLIKDYLKTITQEEKKISNLNDQQAPRTLKGSFKKVLDLNYKKNLKRLKSY